MSNTISIDPSELRELAAAMRGLNTRNLDPILSGISTRNSANSDLSRQKNERQERFAGEMFGQIESAGLLQLMTSFSDSYNRRSSLRPLFNRVLGHQIPSSMEDVFFRRVNHHAPQNKTRWDVGGVEWSSSQDRELKRRFNAMTSAIDTVLNKVEDHRTALEGFERTSSTTLYRPTGAGVANRAFVSRLNNLGDRVPRVFEGRGARSGEEDAIVAAVTDVFGILDQNINLARDKGAELADQSDSLATYIQAQDQQLASKMFGPGESINGAELMKSQVSLSVHRSALLSDGRGLESAYEEQIERRYERLKLHITEAVYDVADFIAHSPASRVSISHHCREALEAIDNWHHFIENKLVELRVQDDPPESTSSAPVFAPITWGNGMPRGNFENHLNNDLVADIRTARARLKEWEAAFRETERRAQNFVQAMNNNDEHLRNLKRRITHAIYQTGRLGRLQTFATNVKDGLLSQATMFNNFANTLDTGMSGQTVTAYANALRRGSRYFKAIAQRIEIEFWDGEFSGDVDRALLFSPRLGSSSFGARLSAEALLEHFRDAGIPLPGNLTDEEKLTEAIRYVGELGELATILEEDYGVGNDFWRALDNGTMNYQLFGDSLDDARAAQTAFFFLSDPELAFRFPLNQRVALMEFVAENPHHVRPIANFLRRLGYDGNADALAWQVQMTFQRAGDGQTFHDWFTASGANFTSDLAKGSDHMAGWDLRPATPSSRFNPLEPPATPASFPSDPANPNRFGSSAPSVPNRLRLASHFDIPRNIIIQIARGRFPQN